jgi:protease II
MVQDEECLYRVWGGYCTHRENDNYCSKLKIRDYKKSLPAKKCIYKTKDCRYLAITELNRKEKYKFINTKNNKCRRENEALICK